MNNSPETLIGEHRSPSGPGFTWELFCIAVILLSGLVVTIVDSIESANNKFPKNSLLLTELALWLLILKLTPVLTNKYRARQRSDHGTTEVVLMNDTRSPVLYLRSFRDDETIARATAFYSTEQEMKAVFSDIGPFITIAEPDKPVPVDPGAARMRLSQNAWQQQVSDEMLRAALVIVRIGQSDGLWWELSEAFKRVKPNRLVLLVPAEDEQLYEELRERAHECLSLELPEYEPGRGPFSNRGSLIYFGPDWSPHLQKLKTAWLRQTFWDRSSAVLKIGLKPVYEQIGLEWGKPPVQPFQVCFLMVFFFLAILFLYLTYAMVSNILRIL